MSIIVSVRRFLYPISNAKGIAVLVKHPNHPPFWAYCTGDNGRTIPQYRRYAEEFYKIVKTGYGLHNDMLTKMFGTYEEVMKDKERKRKTKKEPVVIDDFAFEALYRAAKSVVELGDARLALGRSIDRDVYNMCKAAVQSAENRIKTT